MSALSGLHGQSLRLLAEALTSGRLAPPLSSFGLSQVLGPGNHQPLAESLNELATQGDAFRLMGKCLELALDRPSETVPGTIDLIWSGPDEPESLAESTSVTLRELFRSAAQEILISGYTLYNGRDIFEPLARRMEDMPELQVTLVMNITRKDNDTSLDGSVVARWREQFFKRQWPGSRRPSIFHDPRSLRMERDKRAVMHAKCILVDRRIGLVSSANLTEAALFRNIEAGLLVRDSLFIHRLQRNFEVLIEKGFLKPI